MRAVKYRAWFGDRMQLVKELHFSDNGSVTIVGEDDGMFLLKSDGKPWLMEYTGRKDKNGVEIAEGDIVRGFGTNGVVEYFDNLNWDSGGSLHAGFYCQQWFEYKEEGALSYHYGFSDCEIIGNVHENEELLK